jgi:hypothetical protein
MKVLKKTMLNLIKKIFATGPKDQPLNELERLFRKALREPAARPGFYRLLLESDLFVSGTFVRPGEADLQFYDVAGEKVLPVFSHEERLKTVLGKKASTLKFKGRDLLTQVAAGHAIALNPYSDFGREFSLAEIRELLK